MQHYLINNIYSFKKNLLVLFLLACPLASSAGSQVLQEIQYINVDKQQALHIIFALPVHYVSHYPKSKAKTLNIDIRFIDESLINVSQLPILETLLAPEPNTIPLKEVTFETVDEQSKVNIYFKKTVSFTVAQHDAKSLIISFPGLTTGKQSGIVDINSIKKGADYEKNILDLGKQMLRDKQPQRAIEIFSMLISRPAHPQTKDALELLGVAREKNGQTAQAKAVYEQYLKKYPDGEDAIRVSQRIAELIQSQLAPKKKLKSSKDKKSRSMLTSTVSQYYYYGQNNLITTGSNVDQSLLISQISTNWRKRTSVYDMRSFFYANNSHDFITSSNDGIEINSLYWKIKHFNYGYSTTIGRQSGSSGGILGRFDGALFGYNTTENIRVNAAYGFPVLISDKTEIQTNRPFIGLNVEINDYWKGWDINPYLITQKYDGVVDRQALGTELRYFKDNKNFYGMLDYDTSYADLNIVIFRGQYNLSSDTTLIMGVDYRNNPLLETGNALIGQTTSETLDDLLATLTEEQIRDLAEQRTGDSTTLSFGATYSLSKDVQLNGDITHSSQSFKIDTGTATIIEQNESQTYYSGQIILNRLIDERDATILSLRLADTNNYDEYTATITNQLPIKREWRINTRLRYSQREDNDDEKIQKIKPSVKLDHRYNKNIRLLFDLNIEWWNYSGTTNIDNYRRISSSFGYRWNF